MNAIISLAGVIDVELLPGSESLGLGILKISYLLALRPQKMGADMAASLSN